MLKSTLDLDHILKCFTYEWNKTFGVPNKTSFQFHSTKNVSCHFGYASYVNVFKGYVLS